jgi:hypothetical protein
METFDTKTLVRKTTKTEDILIHYLANSGGAILGDRFEKLKAEQDMKRLLEDRVRVIWLLLLLN